MKKLLFIALIGCGAWYSWQQGYLPIPQSAAVDANGRATVQLFVGPECGALCSDVREVLKGHNVAFQEIYLATPDEGRQHRVYRFPLTRVGQREVEGNQKPMIISALAEAYGGSVLTPMEQAAMQGHFGSDGKPAVVVYGAEWCGYCKRERELLTGRGVPFTWVDVEKSAEGRVAYEILQGSGYPVTYVGYRRLNGFNEAALEAAISELM